ncbi:MAG: hypothetical protein RLZZ225_720 [Pseudomonadota bacterium]|jgi:hypothetical protein
MSLVETDVEAESALNVPASENHSDWKAISDTYFRQLIEFFIRISMKKLIGKKHINA